ncbi:DUF1800 family protein [Alteromonas sp. 5E99-2]|uniref:DUF1800 family protein n=1 Tax=Alteromonas sp. 5E99-2 TaxID=2817683 RepID=UPI001A98C8F4|nr:DUF1800 family protein [Alteromonas sp. 5E99-2]MBO1256166.1 DUF1800 family protein [Alteromonas sp. 5E99-2]
MKYYKAVLVSLFIGIISGCGGGGSENAPVTLQEQITPLPQVNLVATQAIAYEKTEEPASFTFTRSSSNNALSVNFELGAGEDPAKLEPNTDDYDLVYLDTKEVVTGTLSFLQGQDQRIIQVRPHVDERFEAPQSLSIRLVEGDGYVIDTPNSQTVEIVDARNTDENQQNFVGIFRPVEGVATTATGVLSLALSGDNQTATLNYNFQNLSSKKQDQFLDIAPSGVTYADLPKEDRVENFVFEIRPGGIYTVNQEVLDALFNGNFFVRILSDDFPEGEIIAAIQRFGESKGQEILEEKLTIDQIDRDVIRFLNQSTFGATEKTYNEIREKIDDSGSNRLQIYEEWIDSQLDMQPTNMTDLMTGISSNEALGIATRFERLHTFWTLAVNSPDQLRHRLAQSLSEILVVSDDVNPIFNAYLGLTTYWDMLASSGSGTYESLLGNVTRHTTMGTYLSHLQNQKENPEEGIFPDENFAREIMQLFSFGLVHLNQDGSLVLDSNNAPIPTYDSLVISEMARVFTGLSVSRVSVRDTDTDVENTNFNADDRNSSGNQAQWTHPMRFFPDFHDFGEKRLFTDQGQQRVIEGRSESIVSADQELDEVISALVGHSSTAPRISGLLIQQLVTSNPSGAYIQRVASAFGENGDMRATIKAILLDQEARNPNVIDVESFGKQKSPLFQLTSFMRMTDVSSQFYLDGRNHDIEFANADRFDSDGTFLRVGAFSTDHINLAAPSVFNFYSPDYSPPGEFANRSLVAPEMELLTETSLFDTINDFFLLIDRGTADSGARADAYSLSRTEQTVVINRQNLNAIYDNAPGSTRDKAAALVDYLDFYYNASQIALTEDISGTRGFIIDAVVNSNDDERLDIALYGVVNAPESLVLK